MSAAFLGLMPHCYHRAKKEKCNVTIAIRRFEPPHTAEHVTQLVDNILDEWKIPLYKIFLTVVWEKFAVKKFSSAAC